MTTKMSKHAAKVDAFIEDFKKESEELATKTFPAKVLELDSLFKQMKSLPHSEIQAVVDIPYPVPNGTDDPPNAKKRKVDEENAGGESKEIKGSKVLVFPNGSVPYNENVHKYCELAKPLMKGLMEHANMVKMWINFLIPKIEDGNNFGVGIQEDVVAEARTVESEAGGYLDQVTRYYLQRARIITKVAKYPHIEDYRQSIKELDERQMLNLQNSVLEMRNHYAYLHDIITKNMAKIKVPRSANAANMY